jgi:hypothetical protein
VDAVALKTSNSVRPELVEGLNNADSLIEDPDTKPPSVVASAQNGSVDAVKF